MYLCSNQSMHIYVCIYARISVVQIHKHILLPALPIFIASILKAWMNISLPSDQIYPTFTVWIDLFIQNFTSDENNFAIDLRNL